MWDAMKATSTPKRLDEPNYDYKHRLLERIAELEAAARAVTWFDWSDNDEDAVRAVDALRKLVGR